MCAYRRKILTIGNLKLFYLLFLILTTAVFITDNKYAPLSQNKWASSSQVNVAEHNHTKSHPSSQRHVVWVDRARIVAGWSGNLARRSVNKRWASAAAVKRKRDGGRSTRAFNGQTCSTRKRRCIYPSSSGARFLLSSGNLVGGWKKKKILCAFKTAEYLQRLMKKAKRIPSLNVKLWWRLVAFSSHCSHPASATQTLQISRSFKKHEGTCVKAQVIGLFSSDGR